MNNLIAFQTILRKEVRRFLRIWTQTLLPSGITMSLYFVIFGTFIGSQIESINGVSYMQFIVPGLIMMAVINNSYSNVVSSFFGSKFGQSIQELLVSPVSTSYIILGYALGGVVRGILVGLIVTLVSLFFVPLQVYSYPLVFLFVVLTAFLFALAGLTNAIFAKKFDDVTIIPTFVLTPLVYLGGVFYSISFLPPFWQSLSKFNPLLYVIDGFRFAFLGFSDISVWIGLVAIAVFTTLLFGLNWYLIENGIRLKE
jgi:ABC-2 type transport system permease protein